jgi:[ribosomal protein S18]-alanine N-acetyltransferase
LTCLVRQMAKKDVSQVTFIDREAFPTMWPPVNFQHELTNRLAHYLVVCDGNKEITNPEPKPAIRLVPVRTFLGFKWPFNPKPSSDAAPPETVQYITGFVGLWIMVDEAHIINIAVREACRGKGIGELLLISSIDTATKLKASVVTLEVRASNTVAQNLYSKYGFSKAGVRRGYYTDNKEDAFIMTTDVITMDAFKRRFQKLKNTHFEKLENLDYKIE